MRQLTEAEIEKLESMREPLWSQRNAFKDEVFRAAKALKVARMQFKQANDEFEVVQNQITTGTTDDDQAPLPMEG